MSQIEALTQAQIDRFPEFVDKWLKVGLSTERVDPKTALWISDYYYTKILRKDKVPVIIMPSPYQAWLAVCILNNTPDQVRQQVWDQVRQQVNEQVWDQVWQQVNEQVAGQVGEPVWDQVSQQVDDQVAGQVRRQVREQVAEQVRRPVEKFVWPYIDGNFQAAYFAFYDYIIQCLGIDIKNNHYAWYKKTTEIALLYPLEKVCIICDRPSSVRLNDRQQPHNLSGLAVSYSDGWGVYAINGVRVSEQIVLRPETITVEQIEKETNSEVRRVMVERYGLSRYLTDSGAQLISSDEFGELYKKDVKDDEPIVMVKVINATPEPDGTRKNYFLRVPPTITAALEAVAWTFGIDSKDYQPEEET